MSRPPRKNRVKSLHDEAYIAFVAELVKLRPEHLSQQSVADAMGWNQSIIAKIEKAQRRVDIIELIRLAEVMGFDVVKLVRETRKRMIANGDLES